MKLYSITQGAAAFALFASAFASTTGAAEPDPVIRIRPIEYTASAPLPDDLPQELFLGGGRDAGSAKIKYLVEGAAIVGIDKLSIDSIKLADGTEISKLREDEKTEKPSGVGKFFFGDKPTKDEPAWQLGTFPRASHDGDYATFELEIHRPLLGKLESTKVTGTATMRLGYDRKNAAVDIPTKEKTTVDVGPYKITVAPVTPSAEPKEKAEPEFPLFGRPSGPSVDLTITGPLAGLDGFEMLDGTDDLNTWYSNEENKRTYHLPVPQTGKITVKLGYWNTIKKVTAPLGP